MFPQWLSSWVANKAMQLQDGVRQPLAAVQTRPHKRQRFLDQGRERAAGLLQHQALSILLQHPCLTGDLQVVCQLLMVSKQLAAAVTDSCSRQLAISCNAAASGHWRVEAKMKHQQLFGTWMARYGGLAGELRLSLAFSADSLTNLLQLFQQLQQHTSTIKHLRIRDSKVMMQHEPSEDVDNLAALQVAARVAFQHLTNLQSFSCPYASLGILSRLPASLQTLSMDGFICDDILLHQHPHEYLSHLTGLRSLEMGAAGNVCCRIPYALMPLRNLTRLKCDFHKWVDMHDTLTELHLLPSQLVELHFYCWSFDDYDPDVALAAEAIAAPLQLGHLTALTNLKCYGCDLCKTPQNVLPPNLVNLLTFKAASAVPLLALSKLQSLVVLDCNTPPSSLVQIGEALSGLTHLSLSFSCERDTASQAALESAALILSSLTALKHLGFDGDEATMYFLEEQQEEEEDAVLDLLDDVLCVTASTLQHLTKLTSLTSLCFYFVAVAAHDEGDLRQRFAGLTGLAVDVENGLEVDVENVFYLLRD